MMLKVMIILNVEDNKGSLLKEQEMTVSYTLSEEDEETVISNDLY